MAQCEKGVGLSSPTVLVEPTGGIWQAHSLRGVSVSVILSAGCVSGLNWFTLAQGLPTSWTELLGILSVPLVIVQVKETGSERSGSFRHHTACQCKAGT